METNLLKTYLSWRRHEKVDEKKWIHLFQNYQRDQRVLIYEFFNDEEEYRTLLALQKLTCNFLQLEYMNYSNSYVRSIDFNIISF